MPGEIPGLCVLCTAGFGSQDADAPQEIKHNSCFSLSHAEAPLLTGIQALEMLISVGIGEVKVLKPRLNYVW